MKIKVGDKVKIRSDLKLNKDYTSKYGVLRINEDMLCFIGQEQIVTEVRYDDTFIIKGSPSWWTEDMVVPIEAKCCDTCYGTGCEFVDKVSNTSTFYCSDYKPKEKSKEDYWLWAYVSPNGTLQVTTVFYNDFFRDNLDNYNTELAEAKEKFKLHGTKVTI